MLEKAYTQTLLWYENSIMHVILFLHGLCAVLGKVILSPLLV